MRSRLVAIGVAAAAGCLGPQVSDEIADPELVLPAGSSVPSIYDDAVLARRIDDNDGVGASVPLLGGFAAGQPVRYWDLGPAPDFATPVFVLFRRTADNQLEKTGHPPIFDRIPGDPGYSPYGALFAVEVTDTYAGELLPSIGALQQAQERGLVKSPRSMPIALDVPIVASGVSADAGGGAQVPQGTFYWNGRSGRYLDFGESALPGGVHVPVVDLYVLRREGGEPLSEPERGVDMNGDGDTLDTNDVFARAGDDPAYSPLCREVEVTVARETRSIDTPGAVDIRAADQLFAAGVPKSPPVIAVRAGARQFNCPIQRGGGN